MSALKLNHGRRLLSWAWLWIAMVLTAALPAPAAAEINYTLGYQGYLTDSSGAEIDGARDIVFTIYDLAVGGTALWTQSKSVTVTAGVYRVVLGETNSITLDRENDYWLGVNVDGDGEMTPRTRITAGMFSLLPNLGQQTVLVAKTGGDHATITDALAAITDAATDNRYLIKVGPGIYNESITMKSWVSIQGSGRETTLIKGPGFDLAGGRTGIVVGADNCTLSELTVEADGASTYNHAVGIHINGTAPYVHDVTVLSHGATDIHYGIFSLNGASPTIRRASVEAYGGTHATGIYLTYSSTNTLDQVQVVARDGTNYNTGVISELSSPLTVSGSSFTASGSGDSANNKGVEDQSAGSSYEKSTFAASGGQQAYGIIGSNCVTIDLIQCQFSAKNASDINNAIQLYASSTNFEANISKCEAIASSSATTGEVNGIIASSTEAAYTISLNLDTVKAWGQGGAYPKGMYGYRTEVGGINVWAAGLYGQTSTMGVNFLESEIYLVNSVIQADGGSSPPASMSVTGVYLNEARAQFLNCTIVADHAGASSNALGINHRGSSTDRSVDLVNSHLSAEAQAVYSASASAFNAGASRISGGINFTSTGAPTCVNCFTGDLAALYSNCTTTP